MLVILGPSAGAQAPPSAVSPATLLALGPLPLPASAFGAEADEGGLDPGRLRPRAGQEVRWLGTAQVWRELPLAGGRLILPGGRETAMWLFAYLDNPRWQSLVLEVETSGKAVAHLEGTRLLEARGGAARAERALPRGLHGLCLQFFPPAEGEAWVRLAATPKGVAAPAAPAFRTEGRRSAARFEDGWQRRSLAGLAVSPAGDRLAFVEEGELRVLALPEGRVVARIQTGRAGELSFLGSDRLGFLAGTAIRLAHLPSGEVKTVVEGAKEAGNLRWSSDGRRVFWLESPAKPAAPPVHRRVNLRQDMKDWNPSCRIWTADLEGGLRRPITAAGDFQVTSFDLDPAGGSLLAVRKVPIPDRPWFTSELWAVDAATLAARRVATLQTGFESWPGDLRFSPDGSRALFVAPPAEVRPPGREPAGEAPPAGHPESHGEHNYHNADLYAVELATGRLERITAAFDPGVASGLGSAPWWGKDGRSIHFVACTGRRLALHTAELGGTGPAFHAWAAGPLALHGLCPALAAEPPRAALLAGGFARYPHLCLLDREEAAPRELHDPNAELLRELELAAPEEFAFLDRAGSRIDGWLYRPPAPRPAKIPLIVYYYGGATATREACNWTHQYLVANGYALYVVNPRGGGEYGRAFADSHVNDWGVRATADILEGIERVLKANPDLDPDRVGCYGGSYGGFTTLDLLTKTDRVAAAVSLFGIANLASYWGGGTWGWTYGDMAMARSFPWNRPDLFTERSPLFKADRIRTPLLLLHGLADTNVPSLESDQMFTALQVLGRPVEYVAFAGEDHGLSGSRENAAANRTMLREWFDRWLKGEPEAWEARWRDRSR